MIDARNMIAAIQMMIFEEMGSSLPRGYDLSFDKGKIFIVIDGVATYYIKAYPGYFAGSYCIDLCQCGGIIPNLPVYTGVDQKYDDSQIIDPGVIKFVAGVRKQLFEWRDGISNEIA